MAAEIHDRGRGPEIKGTRITVYDVLDYTTAGWQPETIAALFKLTVDEVQVAIAYIREHQEEVRTDYEKILERHRKGNPPEIEAKLQDSHAKVLALLKGKSNHLPENTHEGNSAGR